MLLHVWPRSYLILDCWFHVMYCYRPADQIKVSRRSGVGSVNVVYIFLLWSMTYVRQVQVHEFHNNGDTQPGTREAPAAQPRSAKSRAAQSTRPSRLGPFSGHQLIQLWGCECLLYSLLFSFFPACFLRLLNFCWKYINYINLNWIWLLHV